MKLSMTADLTGQVAIVTGASQGLGKAVAVALGINGAHVVCVARNAEKLASTVGEIEALGGKAEALACDVTDRAAAKEAIEGTAKKLGRLDVLVNNAAGNFISPTERLSANAFDTIIDIVLKGTKNCTLAFGKYWIAEQQTQKN